MHSGTDRSSGRYVIKAIILAAGRGTRMGTLTSDLPKGMLSIDGRSLIERQIDVLRHCHRNRVSGGKDQV